MIDRNVRAPLSAALGTGDFLDRALAFALNAREDSDFAVVVNAACQMFERAAGDKLAEQCSTSVIRAVCAAVILQQLDAGVDTAWARAIANKARFDAR